MALAPRAECKPPAFLPTSAVLETLFVDFGDIDLTAWSPADFTNMPSRLTTAPAFFRVATDELEGKG